jgi:hypothetical protein
LAPTATRTGGSSIAYAPDAIATSADAADVSPHDMRRTIVCDMPDANAALTAVRPLAGDAQVTTPQCDDLRGERAGAKAVALIGVPCVASSTGRRGATGSSHAAGNLPQPLRGARHHLPLLRERDRIGELRESSPQTLDARLYLDGVAQCRGFGSQPARRRQQLERPPVHVPALRERRVDSARDLVRHRGGRLFHVHVAHLVLLADLASPTEPRDRIVGCVRSLDVLGCERRANRVGKEPQDVIASLSACFAAS